MTHVLFGSLADRLAMRANRRQHLRTTEPKLSDDKLSKAIDTIDWEFRRGVHDDIETIIANVGRYSRHRDLAGDLTDYVTRR